MQTLLRRLAALGIALAALFTLFPCQTHAVSTSASSAILMDVDSGRVLYEQNADAKMLIASTTKILTALVAIREGDLNDVVTVSREAAYTEGSSMYLKVGEKLTLETLLYGLLLCSGNDAAVAIAEHISGSQEDFAKLMNATAREIGMEHSSFANPNGWTMRTITPRPGTWRVLPARRWKMRLWYGWPPPAASPLAGGP